MSRFGSDPRSFFNSVYQDVPPWDVGGPQPAMSALLAKFPPPGPILDVGCGSGDLAIHLARLGHEVIGIDFVEAAIARAWEKAGSLPPDVADRLTFQVGDALKPSLLPRRFGSVVDSGFYHLFDPEACERFVNELTLALPPGSRYYIHAFDIDFPYPNLPRKVSAEEVQTRFTPRKGWQILDLQSTEFLSRVAPPVPAVCACMERIPAGSA